MTGSGFTDVLTLGTDAGSQEHFEQMRQRHFPPALNRVPAHLSLFHTLPEADAVRDALLTAASRPGFRLHVTGLRSLGRGVAYVVESPELLALHRELSAQFAEVLNAQDRQKFQPHIVIQNKATGEQARELKWRLEQSFQPFEAQATGLKLWRYLNGPWKLREEFPFQPA